MLSILLTALMITALLPAFSLPIFAAQDGDFTYELIDSNTNVKITGYTGDGGDIYLPSKIIEKNVTEIGVSAFKGKSAITGIWFPEFLEIIHDSAFENCINITGSINIPNSTKKIAMNAFYGCLNLKNVEFGIGLRIIDEGAFRGCSSLTTLNIPDTVEYIYSNERYINTSTFGYCTGLTSVTIGNSIKSIREKTFIGCTSLTNITIGNNVEEICQDAFNGCVKLQEVTLPNSMELIGLKAFYGCTSLQSINLGRSLKTIHAGAFRGCSSLKELEIPDSVENIYSNQTYTNTETFGYCTSLTSVKIGNSLNAIPDDAFIGCTKLTTLTIGDWVKEIGFRAFYDCTNLQTIVFGSNLKTINAGAFRGCVGLTTLQIPDSVENIYSNQRYTNTQTFGNCINLTSVTIGKAVKEIPEEAFLGCSKLESVVVGNSVENIGFRAFHGCASLQSIDFGSGLKVVYAGAFTGCSSLIKLNFPDSLESIHSNERYTNTQTFGNCTSLTTVTIGNGLTSIPIETFYGCTNLTCVTLGNNIEYIGENAFRGCTKLTNAYIYGNAPTLGAAVFNSTAMNFSVKYEAGKTGFETWPYPTDIFNPATTHKIVTFNLNGGIGSNFTHYAENNKYVSQPVVPIRTGYTFIEWNTKADGTGAKWDFNNSQVTTDITLYANWSINTFRVYFDPRGGNVNTAYLDVVYNQPIGTLPIPVLSGDIFLGWYPGQNGAGPQHTSANLMPANNYVLYANWQTTKTAYTVLFDNQGGSPVLPIAATLNQTITKPADPTKTGFTFYGWYKDANCTNKWDFATAKVTANVMLYARWVKGSTFVTLPLAPTGLSSPSKTDTTVILAWDSVEGATGYNVYRGTTKLTATPITTTTYMATGLTQNTAYTFTVKAVNEAGESAASSGLTVTTNMTIPAAPTGLTSTGKTDTTVSLSWNTVGGASGYNVYRGGTKLTSTPLTGTTYTATGLTQNTAYTFTVKAVNAAGESAASSGLTVTTNMTIPAAPTGLTSTGKTDTTVSLSWNAVGGATGYNVYRGTTKLTANPIAATTYTATGLTQNTAYTFTVKAVNAAGESAASSGLTVTTNMTIPAAPTGLISTGKTDTTVSLSWNAVGGASGYNVYRGGTKLTSTPLTGTTYTATGLTQNTAYTFTVKAVNAAGESAASSGLTVTTNMTIPAAPTGLTSTGKTDTTVSISWNAVGGASGYNVYRGGTKLTETPLTGTTYTATGLTQNTEYTFTVKAVNAAGESAASSGLTVTTVPHVAISIDDEFLGERIEIKVKAFQSYKRVSLDLEFNAAIDYADIRWTSDNEKVLIDKDGHITNIKSWSRASNIKIELLDANSNVVATDTVRVIFYKWNWQLKKLRTQSVVSDNYAQRNMSVKELELIAQNPEVTQSDSTPDSTYIFKTMKKALEFFMNVFKRWIFVS